MKNCPKCNKQVNDDVKFCNFCGFNIKKHDEENAQRVQSKFCPECGAKLSGGAFCPECGHKLGESAPEPLFDFSDDTKAYEGATFGGFDEMLKKQAEEELKKAIALYEAKQYSEALPVLNKYAEKGNAEAQFLLGVCYKWGYGVKEDHQKSVCLYEKAAEQGHTKAMCFAADYYAGPKTSPRDKQKAAYWYEKAAEQGYTEGQCRIGDYYKNGFGVPKDKPKAAYWYQKAAEQGDLNGIYRLGDCYKYGEGVSKDYKKAVYWYLKAAEQDYDGAKAQLEILKRLGCAEAEIALANLTE